MVLMQGLDRGHGRRWLHSTGVNAEISGLLVD